MVLTEYLTSSSQDSQYVILGYKIPTWVWKSYCVLGVFGFGAGCSHLTTDVMKYTVGRLRPHFYTVCQPNIDCSDPKNLQTYHVNFQCTNSIYLNEDKIMKELR